MLGCAADRLHCGVAAQYCAVYAAVVGRVVMYDAVACFSQQGRVQQAIQNSAVFYFGKTYQVRHFPVLFRYQHKGLA